MVAIMDELAESCEKIYEVWVVLDDSTRMRPATYSVTPPSGARSPKSP